MEHQLLKIESYSKAFAEKICNSFFINREEITGEQIVTLTSVEQVNLFVLKNLFERWIDESYKLRSPYFDYENENVKEGMQQFMNVLSRHILIKKEFFRPLLENATYETLTLLLEPSLYLKTELGRDGQLIIQDFISKKKFYKVYKPFWDRIINSSKSTISIAELQKEIDSEEISAIKVEYLAKFSEVLPLDILSAITKQEGPVSAPPVQNVETFPTPSPLGGEDKKSSIPVEPKVEIRKEEAKNKESFTPSINEKFISTQMTVNDLLAQNQSKTIAEQLGKGKLENIRSAISLNQKFQFINYLFLGQAGDYETAINEVEKCATFEQALNLLNQNYANRYHWDFNKAEVADFISLVEQRFA